MAQRKVKKLRKCFLLSYGSVAELGRHVVIRCFVCYVMICSCLYNYWYSWLFYCWMDFRREC